MVISWVPVPVILNLGSAFVILSFIASEIGFVVIELESDLALKLTLMVGIDLALTLMVGYRAFYNHF